MVLLLSFGQSPEFFSGSVVCDSACVFVVGDGWDAEDGQVRYVWIDLSAVLGACVIVVLTTAAQDFTGWEAALVVASLWAFGKEHPFSAAPSSPRPTWGTPCWKRCVALRNLCIWVGWSTVHLCDSPHFAQICVILHNFIVWPNRWHLKQLTGLRM